MTTARRKKSVQCEACGRIRKRGVAVCDRCGGRQFRGATLVACPSCLRWVRAPSVSKLGECHLCFERSYDHPVVLAFEGESNAERERVIRYTEHWLQGRLPSEAMAARERPGDDTLLAQWIKARRAVPFQRTAASTDLTGEVALPKAATGIRPTNGQRGRNGDRTIQTPMEALQPTTPLHAGGTHFDIGGQRA